MTAVTTHVLDTALGRPATGVPVRLERLDAAMTTIAEGATDDDGRVRKLGPGHLEPGPYRLSFDTDAYFAAIGTTGFFPEVAIAFTITDVGEHYHVPLLLSPFSYSTYRGS
ncbi:MAG TPA: hydroxyisourate hydrolase [Nocardioidaceae bacterium]|nr:hydroxyisourate hydrolase [Nocardioidaceae bacterium]